MSSFAIHPNLAIKVVGRLRDELLPLLKDYSVELLPEESGTAPELVISYGGDGTLLGAERDYPGIPKLALRDRTHNPRCEEHSEARCLEAFFCGKMHGDSFCKLIASTKDGQRRIALNDIVVGRQLHPLGAIRFRVLADGAVLQSQVIADGLVIATPYGSTGYFQSITRGNFQTGIGLAYSNPMEGQSFQVIPESSRLDIQILRGPALVQAGNNPEELLLQDGDCLSVSQAPDRAQIFGLEAFRCRACYLLRRNGSA